jgi:hypothetical protein
MNYFGILSRSNDLIYQATRDNINADFIVQFMDEMSLNINWLTVIVLDNASVHTAKKVKDLLGVWEKRGLYLFLAISLRLDKAGRQGLRLSSSRLFKPCHIFA